MLSLRNIDESAKWFLLYRNLSNDLIEIGRKICKIVSRCSTSVAREISTSSPPPSPPRETTLFDMALFIY